MSQANIEVVRQLYEALAHGDTAAIDELTDPHVRIHTLLGSGKVYGFGE